MLATIAGPLPLSLHPYRLPQALSPTSSSHLIFQFPAPLLPPYPPGLGHTDPHPGLFAKSLGGDRLFGLCPLVA